MMSILRDSPSSVSYWRNIQHAIRAKKNDGPVSRRISVGVRPEDRKRVPWFQRDDFAPIIIENDSMVSVTGRQVETEFMEDGLEIRGRKVDPMVTTTTISTIVDGW